MGSWQLRGKELCKRERERGRDMHERERAKGKGVCTYGGNEGGQMVKGKYRCDDYNAPKVQASSISHFHTHNFTNKPN